MCSRFVHDLQKLTQNYKEKRQHKSSLSLSSCVNRLTMLLSLLIFTFVVSSKASQPLPTSFENVDTRINQLYDGQEIPHFRMLNRRQLLQCPDPNPYIRITTDAVSPLSDEQNVTVTVSGILKPLEMDWVAMITPSHSSVNGCPLNSFNYIETGDLSNLPLLCHYPVKAVHLKSDPNYLPCKKHDCKKRLFGICLLKTCSASVTFHVINIRTDVEFVFFSGGFQAPCVLKSSKPLQFANPDKPLYGHISSIDSSAASMRVTWVSGSGAIQQVQYGNGKSESSVVTTFSRKDMCGSSVKSPAQDFGWHDPGYIHTAVMKDLHPNSKISYRYGSDSIGWSVDIQLQTPPPGGSDELKFLAFGDMGKAPLDSTIEHFIQPGSISVVTAMAKEVASGNVDSIFHIGDISYATGFLVEWDYFLHLITPLASHVPYMTAIGNHERDYIDSGSVYKTPDSGGECGVPYETYFPMPTPAKDKPWYSIEQGPVHFTVISTEHNWKPNSEQYNWMKSDMASVDRKRTPWLVFAGHRPMYTTAETVLVNVDTEFVKAVEPLLLKNKVDLALFGHVHSYERTCAIYDGKCRGEPVKDENGIDTFDSTIYTAPVHAIIGMAGFKLDKFSSHNEKWSLSRISEFGYTRVHATKKELKLEFVSSKTSQVEDSFRIIKGSL